MANSIKKNTVYNIIKTLSTIVFPLITFPYVSHVLGVVNIGKINFAASIISYISLIATLGISTYAIRSCSCCREDKLLLSQTASEIYSINIFSTVLAYIVLLGLFIFWKKLNPYKTLILLYSINVLMTTLGADWINSAMEDFRYITLRTFVFQILSLVLMFVFVHRPEHYAIYTCISVISASGGNLVNIFYRRKYCKICFVGFRKVQDYNYDAGILDCDGELNNNSKSEKYIFSGIRWKQHLPPIMLLFSMLIAQTIFVSVDTTMLGIMRDDREVGLYSTSTKIYTMVNQVVASIAWVVMPQLSYLFKNVLDNTITEMRKLEIYEEINKILHYSLNFIIVVGLPCVVGLFALAPEVIELVGGKAYMDAVPSLRILCVALAVSFIAGFYGNIILLPSGREKICLIVCVCSALINFILNFIMIPRWGLNAAAITTLVSQIVCLIGEIPFIEKEVRVGNISKMLFAPLVGSIGIVGLVYLIKCIDGSLIMRSLLSVFSCAMFYIFILLIFKNEFALNILKALKEKFFK